MTTGLVIVACGPNVVEDYLLIVCGGPGSVPAATTHVLHDLLIIEEGTEEEVDFGCRLFV